MEKVNVYSKEFWVKSFIGYFSVSVPILIISIILNLSGDLPLNINGVPRYGIGPSLILVFYFPFMSFLFAILNWVFVMAGNWLFDKVRLIFKK
jgi:hypothetical protein